MRVYDSFTLFIIDNIYVNTILSRIYITYLVPPDLKGNSIVEGKTSDNTQCDQFVELVDLFPIFAKLWGLKAPANLEETSFRPLLGEPNKPWKTTACTQAQRGGTAGKSVRTKRWRYHEWIHDGKVISAELCDMQAIRRDIKILLTWATLKRFFRN